MSRTYHCEKNCCKIEVCEYKNAGWYKRRKGPSIKAGVFIYDPVESSVLLVQSRGLLWGCPKGTLETEKNETTIECAVRELKEETGIDANPEKFSKVTNIKNRAIYYYMEMKTCEVKVQTHEGNDANGITWIKMSCLEDCINSGMISLNQHARVVFKKFMDKSFPKGDFKKVEFRHTKRSR